MPDQADLLEGSSRYTIFGDRGCHGVIDGALRSRKRREKEVGATSSQRAHLKAFQYIIDATEYAIYITVETSSIGETHDSPLSYLETSPFPRHCVFPGLKSVQPASTPNTSHSRALWCKTWICPCQSGQNNSQKGSERIAMFEVAKNISSVVTEWQHSCTELIRTKFQSFRLRQAGRVESGDIGSLPDLGMN
ncbi:uncharacterized protein RAG0_03884 [Rhynchosporium agropyri]|uniref:Uncharacterized protein n=1 Tax=Rhynchosporium agropyri TaxID=914238 RepID=A0A1E1K6M1_9HELO|nr:uncharacterized protein RAG0_03884 [Rhynchosporium agropyri]